MSECGVRCNTLNLFVWSFMETVVVGMSGGVDSSVAALLLKEQGYRVIGLFMHNWEEQDERGICTAESDFGDVRSVCDQLEIPYYSVNFAKEYMQRVFSSFLEEYQKGRTPNPDVLCNREIKFGPFLEYAEKVGADYIATGHYAKVFHEGGVTRVQKADDQNKDQTYFLNQLSQRQLAKVLFPLGTIQKDKVRKIAEQCGLSTAQKKDSTGICFIGERKFREFLMHYLPAKSGDIKTLDGKTVGTHCGLMYYTIGQRRGLGIGGKEGFEGKRWFVLKKDLTQNILYVSCGEDDVLFSSGLRASGFNWIPQPPKVKEFDAFAKIRYRQPDQKAHITMRGQDVFAEFHEKQRAVTEGQWLVLYDEDGYMLGGGVIEEKW